jgi:hypothetical protein
MSTDPPLDDLHTQLVEAIHKAELEPSLSHSGVRAWSIVSSIEEDIANHPDASPVEQSIAQCGAITAAYKARNFGRARVLGQLYRLEQSARTADGVCWDRWTGMSGSIFDEGFPIARDEEYTIVLGNGRRLTATLDLSRQYGAEGIQWRTNEGTFHKFVVAAWFAKRLNL